MSEPIVFLTMRDVVAAAIIVVSIWLTSIVVASCAGCIAWRTLPTKAQVMAINEFRASVGLDSVSVEDLR